MTDKIAILEAILFVFGEPIAISDLAQYLQVSRDECEQLLENYRLELAKNERGLILIQNSDTVQLATKPTLQSFIDKFIKEEFRENLTPAALETLSLVAYLGPLTRATIDQIRGVNSSFILRNLLLRGLIERSPDPQHSHTFLYRVSNQFLAHLGLSEPAQLPQFEYYRTALERFTAEQNSSL